MRHRHRCLRPRADHATFAFHFWFFVRYTLIQLFSRYGKLSKLDFLFHKSGPFKGKPRGYAFVEYADAEVRLRCAALFVLTICNLQSAAKALAACHQKLIRGRKMSITYANQVYFTFQHRAVSNVFVRLLTIPPLHDHGRMMSKRPPSRSSRLQINHGGMFLR